MNMNINIYFIINMSGMSDICLDLYDEEIYKKFIKKFQKKITFEKICYKIKFISTFIPVNLFGCIILSDFKERLHENISNTSLCDEERDFFHFVVDCNVNEKIFIETLYNKYMSIPKLHKCQLGNVLQMCLAYSFFLEICH